MDLSYNYWSSCNMGNRWKNDYYPILGTVCYWYSNSWRSNHSY